MRRLFIKVKRGMLQPRALAYAYCNNEEIAEFRFGDLVFVEVPDDVELKIYCDSPSLMARVNSETIKIAAGASDIKLILKAGVGGLILTKKDFKVKTKQLSL